MRMLMKLIALGSLVLAVRRAIRDYRKANRPVRNPVGLIRNRQIEIERSQR